jgi:hypothetical protein
MAVLKASRTAQNVLSAEFSWAFGDTMLNTSGASDNFTTAAAHAFDIINLPPNAVVIGGELSVTTAFDGSTYALIVGDSGSTNRYLSTADRKAAGRTALVPTGYVGAGEAIRLTVTPTGTTTAGAGTIRIQYIVVGRANEVQAT